MVIGVRSQIIKSMFISRLHNVNCQLPLTWISVVDKVLFDGSINIRRYQIKNHISTNLILNGSRDSEILLSKESLCIKEDKNYHIIGVDTDLIDIGRVALREWNSFFRVEGTLEFRNLQKGLDYDIQGLKKGKFGLIFIKQDSKRLFVYTNSGSKFDLGVGLHDFRSDKALHEFIWAEQPDKKGILGPCSVVLKSVRAIRALQDCLVEF